MRNTHKNPLDMDVTYAESMAAIYGWVLEHGFEWVEEKQLHNSIYATDLTWSYLVNLGYLEDLDDFEDAVRRLRLLPKVKELMESYDGH